MGSINESIELAINQLQEVCRSYGKEGHEYNLGLHKFLFHSGNAKPEEQTIIQIFLNSAPTGAQYPTGSVN